MSSSPPNDPVAYAAWLDDLERQWQAGLIPAPQGVAAILLNTHGEVLLQLRDDKPHTVFPGYWTLPGGVVEGAETPDAAMRRELEVETGLRVALSLWKRYTRRSHSRAFDLEQFVYTATVDVEAGELTLGEGQALRYFGREALSALKIAFGFEVVLSEFFGEGRS